MADEKDDTASQIPVRDYQGDESLRGNAITAGQIELADGKMLDVTKGLPQEDDKTTETGGDTKEEVTGDLTKEGDVKAAPVDKTTTETKEGADTKVTPTLDNPETWLTKDTDEQIQERLTKAGGFYADPRYLAGALEFERIGTVTPETQAKMAASFGVPVDMVETFVKGQIAERALLTTNANTEAFKAEAEARANASALWSIAGGQQQYEAFETWVHGSNALPPEDIAAYNDAMDKNPQAAQALLRGFVQAWKASGGTDGGRDVTSEAAAGKGGTTSTVQPYTSSAEMQRDMGSRRYEEDPQFQAQVQARLAVSGDLR